MPEYDTFTEEFKKDNPYISWRFPFVRQRLQEQIDKHRATMNKTTENNKIPLKYKNTKNNIFILAQQYRKIDPEIKEIIQKDFERIYKRDVDTSNEKDILWLVKEAKRY